MTQMKISYGWVAAVSLLTVGSLAENAVAADNKPAVQPGLQAAPPATRPSQPETLKPGVSEADEEGTLPERIDVQAMKRRYWTVGNEDLMDVVQNRLYKKKGRVEVGARYGFWSDDPFQDANSYGVSIGYHINEFASIHGFYAAVNPGPSAAFTTAVERSFTPVVNPAESVFGVEGRGSLIYGKLSLLGNAIIYYDFNFALGLAKLSNPKGGDSPLGIMGGFGQQVYLNKNLFITIDYRLIRHSDKFGAVQTNLNSTRSVTTSWIQLGVGAFFN